jgi:hypothetical protein
MYTAAVNVHNWQPHAELERVEVGQTDSPTTWLLSARTYALSQQACIGLYDLPYSNKRAAVVVLGLRIACWINDTELPERRT